MVGSGPLRRVVLRALEGLGRRRWGYVPRLAPYLVAEMGLMRAVVWFLINTLRYELTLRTLGPLRTHLVGLTVALIHGCRFSAMGHSYALELAYLRQQDRLLPVAAGTIAEWAGLTPKEIRDRLTGVLQQAGLPLEVLWVDRTIALLEGRHVPIDRSEARICRLARTISVLTAAGLANTPTPDEPAESEAGNAGNVQAATAAA